jgi:alkylation response protein AidB-like acyl-CoA dehydrogenase
MSLILSRRDLDFLLYDWLDVCALTQHLRYADHSRETFDAVLDTSERIAQQRFAPHNKKSDHHEPSFDGHRVTLIPEVKAALDAYRDAGLFAAGQDAELGGMQLPVVVEKAAFAWFLGANAATSGYPLLTIGNANTLLAHGTPAQIEAFAKPEVEGRYFGTMCLSEPQAGSSLSDITTRADYEQESPLGPQYRLRGNKMWISGGEHELSENIVHLVLAKVPDAQGRLIPGTRGISLFVVPKFLVEPDGSICERNDVTLAGLNHKMGYRGTVNCLLNFGEGTRYTPRGKAGAIGYLVGPLHQGLACMFHMMNEARIGVGLGATMLGYTGYLHALDYARTRRQGRALTAAGKQADSPQIPLIEHADIRRMLLAQKSYVEGALALNLYCAKLVDMEREGDAAERERAGLLLELLTPIAKSWPSQWCLAANDLAIQVHGGYGYTRDYNVEQFYRDNRLNPIHEGTHGIQAVDLLGRKVVMREGAALSAFRSSVETTIAAAQTIGALQPHAQQLETALASLVNTTHALSTITDPQKRLANASIYLEAFGHLVLAWIWLEQAVTVSHQPASDFGSGKLQACRYFFEYELPRIQPQIELLARVDTTTLDMQGNWF